MWWYLAGPICHVVDGSDKDWRECAKQKLHCIDPFEEEENVWPEERYPGEMPKNALNRLRTEGRVVLVRKLMQDILALDERSVARADGLLVYSPKPSWGTIREVSLAYQQHKPVVIWTEATRWALSNTLIGMSTNIVQSLESAIAKCLEIQEAR